MKSRLLLLVVFKRTTTTLGDPYADRSGVITKVAPCVKVSATMVQKVKRMKIQPSVGRTTQPHGNASTLIHWPETAVYKRKFLSSHVKVFGLKQKRAFEKADSLFLIVFFSQS